MWWATWDSPVPVVKTLKLPFDETRFERAMRLSEEQEDRIAARRLEDTQAPSTSTAVPVSLGNLKQ